MCLAHGETCVLVFFKLGNEEAAGTACSECGRVIQFMSLRGRACAPLMFGPVRARPPAAVQAHETCSREKRWSNLRMAQPAAG